MEGLKGASSPELRARAAHGGARHSMLNYIWSYWRRSPRASPQASLGQEETALSSGEVIAREGR